IVTVPGAAISDGPMETSSSPSLTNSAWRLLPFQVTVAPKTKLVPRTISVNAAEPACTWVGEILLMAGTGLEIVVEHPAAASAATVSSASRARGILFGHPACLWCNSIVEPVLPPGIRKDNTPARRPRIRVRGENLQAGRAALRKRWQPEPTWLPRRAARGSKRLPANGRATRRCPSPQGIR